MSPGFDPTQPFTRAEGLAAGMTPWELRGSGVVRLHRNVYVARTTPRTLDLRCRAVMRIAPAGTVISDNTAATLWGGSVPSSANVHVRIPPGETFRVKGVSVHEKPRCTPRWWHGLPMTSPEDTFCDVAERLDLVQLAVLGDRLVRRERTTPQQLVTYATAWHGRQADLVRSASRLVRAGVDSPPETRLRMLVVLAGLPEPTVNHIVRDPHTGAWLRRFELAYPDLRLAIEYEGRQHRDDDEIWASDIDRREDLDRHSWRVIQVISTGLYDSPLRTLQRIDQARVDRGAKPTRVFAEEWRRFFPGRGVA